MPAGARASASGDPYAAQATASTLNYALGRRHMKSWMTGTPNGAPATSSSHTPISAPAPIRKRGRPKECPPDAVNRQHATEAARPPNAPSAERLPSSNSTSPQLANIVTTHQRTPGHDHARVTVFPSPTPSEEDVRSGEMHNNETETRQIINLGGFDIPPLQSPNASSPPRATIVEKPVMQCAPVPKRPARDYPAAVDKRPRVDIRPWRQPDITTRRPSTSLPSDLPPLPEFLQSPPAPPVQRESQEPSRSPPTSHLVNGQLASPELVRATQQQGHPPNLRSDPSPVQGQPSQGQPAQGRAAQGQSVQRQVVQGHPVRSPPVRQTHVSPPLHAQPFRVSPNVQHAVQPHRVRVSQRRVSYPDDWYSLDMCMQMLETFKMNNTARSRRDELRLHVLQEAVRTEDWAYLTLHQCYCVMTCSVQALPQDLQRNPNLNVAFSLMQDILDDNLQLTPPLLHFFCNFPFPMDYLRSKWPTRYQHAERDFLAFVHYSPNVATLRLACERRGIPPTPREIANCAITSLTFQRLLFRSIIRTLWRKYPRSPEQGMFEDQALQAFSRAQAVFNQRSSQGQLGGRQQADEELQSWSYNFIHIARSLEILLQRQGFQLINPPALQMYQQQQQSQPRSHTNNLPYNASVPWDMTMARRRPPPPTPPPPQTTHPRTASQARPQLRHGFTALLPQPGLIQPQQRVPNPPRFGLHQAHLRSPVLQASNLSSPAHYFWQGFIERPKRLTNPNNATEKLSFILSRGEMDLIAEALPTAPGAADSRAIDGDHKMIRLRCVKWPSKEEPKDSAWAIAENSWIPHSYFTFNRTPLQLRKKVHHGKDLPVDLTGLVREGPNILEVSVMSNASDTTHRDYLLAVEFLGVMTQASIKKRCRENRISAEKSINDIKRKLSLSATDEGDDDIVVVESTLTINLRDPFSASKICDIPVRGTACLHNECFDLDTFLDTRPRKGDVSAAGQWRCPICKADARPNVLVVDEFLVEVRRELESKGLLETRAIIVDQDGTWKPKPEERDPHGVQDRDTPEPTPTAVPTAARPNPPAAYEVIDLDSD